MTLWDKAQIDDFTFASALEIVTDGDAVPFKMKATLSAMAGLVITAVVSLVSVDRIKLAAGTLSAGGPLRLSSTI